MEDDCHGLPELFGQWTADRGPRTAHFRPRATDYFFHGTGMNTNKSKQLGKIRISQNIASNVLQRKSNVIAPETVADSRYTSITVCEWSKFHILDRALHPVGKAQSSVHKLYLTVSLTFSRQIQCTRKFQKEWDADKITD